MFFPHDYGYKVQDLRGMFHLYLYLNKLSKTLSYQTRFISTSFHRIMKKMFQFQCSMVSFSESFRNNLIKNFIDFIRLKS